jgi:hypothetical protein
MPEIEARDLEAVEAVFYTQPTFDLDTEVLGCRI